MAMTLNPLVLISLLVSLFLARPAFGYTDPGSGLLLWQILAAAAIGALFQFRRAWRKLLFWRRKDGNDSQNPLV